MLAVVVMLRVEVAVGDTVVGFREQVAFAGHPLRVRFTLPVYPLIAVAVIVELPEPPADKVTVDGFDDNAKFGVGGPPQPTNWNDPIWVLQLKLPLAFSYSVENQNVQSSLGSIRSAE